MIEAAEAKEAIEATRLEMKPICCGKVCGKASNLV